MKVPESMLIRRREMFGSRISESALELSMRMYVYMLLGQLITLLAVIMAIIASTTFNSVTGFTVFIIGLACSTTIFIRALAAGKAAGIDIAHQYGLPVKAWKSIHIKTPADFDTWLQKARSQSSPGSSNGSQI